MKIKLLFLLLTLGYNVTIAQTYDKDWAILIKKIDAGQKLSVKELENFETKYKKQFDTVYFTLP